MAIKSINGKFLLFVVIPIVILLFVLGVAVFGVGSPSAGSAIRLGMFLAAAVMLLYYFIVGLTDRLYSRIRHRKTDTS